jgi:hypothetical protein
MYANLLKVLAREFAQQIEVDLVALKDSAYCGNPSWSSHC